MYIIYGKRYNKYDPIVDGKTGEVIDDGSPKQVKLGQWESKTVAENMAENIKKTVPKRSWNIWVEEIV